MDIDTINRELQKLVPTYITIPDSRKRLYTLLTLINVDIPLNICQAIERILFKERLDPIPFDTILTNKTQYDSRIILYHGDITRLAVDAIVNAANSEMLGCFDPSHKCIDNIIHSKAGPYLRMECRQIRRKCGELGSSARITKAYCLPCKYIIHVAGPRVTESLPNINQTNELAKCYSSSLDLAKEYNLHTIAFCCISTGLYGYPKHPAAILAINTVTKWLNTHDYDMSIIFDVFTYEDHTIYTSLLH